MIYENIQLCGFSTTIVISKKSDCTILIVAMVTDDVIAWKTLKVAKTLPYPSN